MSKRNEERIAFTQYTLGREGVGQREIVEGQSSEGGGGGWARRVETE